MPQKTRKVWRGRRRQKLQALIRSIKRIRKTWDARIMPDYRIGKPGSFSQSLIALSDRATICLNLEEVIPEVPEVVIPP